MATFDSADSNILDAETVNWRLIVYPVLAVIVVLLGGFAYYYYQLSQRELLENNAHAALVQAKTPEEMIKVAVQFAGTDQAAIASLAAGESFFDKQDYDGAAKAYQSVITAADANKLLQNTAQLGLAASLEGAGKVDDAINAYLVAARLGEKSPYAPFAYSSAARLYDQKGDKDNERKILLEASSLDPDSSFVKEAQAKLKQLTAPAPGSAASILTPAPSSGPQAPAPAPVPVPMH